MSDDFGFEKLQDEIAKTHDRVMGDPQNLFDQIAAMNNHYRDMLDSVNVEPTIMIQRARNPVNVDALSLQVGGDHYKKLGEFQPWVVASKWLTPEELKGAMKLTVLSYLCRESDKGGREDIKKV
jgi:hypothetical protein